jgi:hypothetical protein
VDLEDHLVGREQHVHGAARAVGRGEELERFLRHAPAGGLEPEPGQHLDAALLADAAVPVERTGLGDPVGMGRDRQPRQHVAVFLHDVAARARHQAMRRGAHLDARLPVDDPWVASGRGGLGVEQVEPLAA